MVTCRVVLLDQENFQTDISKGAIGQELFDNVKQKLNLEEADYFSLSFRNSQNLRIWLNLDKRVDKQIESGQHYVFYWEVKFYPPSPEMLNEDLTRYLVVLQVRQDLYSGRLPASFQTLAILGSYTAQGELGDYERGQHIGIDHLSPYKFAPKQSEELLYRISDLHKTHKGLTPAEADLYFLDNAKKMALYGVDMYPVKDASNREINIGVSASGLYVYEGKLRFNTLRWQRILKISYKRNVFYAKVRPGEFEKHEKTYGFKLPSPKLAKRLWRVAVEHHQFFRLKTPELTDSKSLPGFGRKRWRMSGRTQAQLKNVGVPRKSFSRTSSFVSTDNYNPTQSLGNSATLPLNDDHKETSGRIYNTYNGQPNERFESSFEDDIEPNEDQLNGTSTMQRTDHGAQYTPTDNQYRAEDDLVSQQQEKITENAAAVTSEAPQEIRDQQGDSYTQRTPTALPRAPVTPPRAPAVPVRGPFGAGELPMPVFGRESAGVTSNGDIDNSVILETSEKGQKIVKIGMRPPTVSTTSMKFVGESGHSTRSTRSPPTVPTRKSYYKYNNNNEQDKSFIRATKKISETTTYTTERDGHIEKRVKHKIVLTGNEDVSDKLLLDAIHSVTGLDPSLGVDKIEIKTEEECS